MIHCLLPLSTHLSPRRTAVVRMARGSEPACGSESANAPTTASPEVSRVTYFSRWASVPNLWMSSAHMFVTAMATEVEAHAAAISIIARA